MLGSKWLTDIAADDSRWVSSETLIKLPSMIYYEYEQIRQLATDGNVYGIMLAIKDAYETVMKVPTVLSLAIIDSDESNKDTESYRSIMKIALGRSLTMGGWETLAKEITNQSDISLPTEVKSVLEKTLKLYKRKIGGNANVRTWRNEGIGHGSLKHADDDQYRLEVSELIDNLKVYFEGDSKYSLGNLYDNVVIVKGDEKIIGDRYKVDLEADYEVQVGNRLFKLGEYASDTSSELFLFDSFFAKSRTARYSAYIDGNNHVKSNKYFNDLYGNLNRHYSGEIVKADIIKTSDDKMLACLNSPVQYIKPQILIDEIEEAMEDAGSGVITISMERGTGKSALASQMDGIVTAPRDCLIDEMESRCFHISHSTYRGVGEFISSVNHSFKHGYGDVALFRDGQECLPSLSLDSDSPAEDMADFLNRYHELYQDSFDNSYTVLVIDGIDELVKENSVILDFIPSSDLLDTGVFILLLTRFIDESTVIGESKPFITRANEASKVRIESRRDGNANVDVLTRYISSSIAGEISEEEREKLLTEADYRFLYLKVFVEVNVRGIFNHSDEYEFVRSYFNFVFSCYGTAQQNKLKKIAAAVALFQGITLREYCDYISYEELTYDLLGLLNDLMPILTVRRVNGEACYEPADTRYSDYILSEFKDAVSEVISGVFAANSDFGELMMYDSDFDSFSFYAKSYLTLWNHAKTYKYIKDLYLSSGAVINLYLCNRRSSVRKTIYGDYLLGELSASISTVLQNAMEHECEGYLGWVSHINELVRSRQVYAVSFGDPEELQKLFLEHESHISDVSCWFWLVKGKRLTFDAEEQIVDVIIERGYANSFVEWILSGADEYWGEFNPKLLSAGLDSEIEAQALNVSLETAIDKYHSRREEDKKRIEYYLDTIESKGYSLEQREAVLKKIEDFRNGKFEVRNLEIFAEEKAKLLDFGTEYKLSNEAYETLSRTLRDGEYNENYVSLYNALLLRADYEYDVGNFSALIRLWDRDYSIRDTLATVSSDEKEELELTDKWLKRLADCRALCDTSTARRIIGINSSLSRRRINLSKSIVDKDTFLTYVEEDVYIFANADNKDMMLLRPRDASEIQQTFIDRVNADKNVVLISNNVFYALETFRQEGDLIRFDRLMTNLENSIKLVDEWEIMSHSASEYYEDYKFRFFAYYFFVERESDFEYYIAGYSVRLKETIFAEIDMFDKDSNVILIKNIINNAVDYAWSTTQYSLGICICDDIIDRLKTTKIIRDEETGIIIDKEIRLIESFKLFLRRCDGEEVDYTKMDISYLSFDDECTFIKELKTLARGITDLDRLRYNVRLVAY